MNLYGFVDNNPVNKNDILGLLSGPGVDTPKQHVRLGPTSCKPCEDLVIANVNDEYLYEYYVSIRFELGKQPEFYPISIITWLMEVEIYKCIEMSQSLVDIKNEIYHGPIHTTGFYTSWIQIEMTSFIYK